MKVVVFKRGADKPLATLSGVSTVEDVKKALHKKIAKYYPSRQRFAFGGDRNYLKDDATLADYGVRDGDTLIFKDLGPQVSWTTVFITEYAGPFLIYPIFFFLLQYIYGDATLDWRQAPQLRQLALICWSFHYFKRLFETIFVHRFSNGTMPMFNIFKNSSYYWGAGAFVGYFVNHPHYTFPSYGWQQVYAGLGIFAISELLNGVVHLQLRALRPPGTKAYKIPRGILFSYISCPNYTFEVLAWVGFAIMTQSVAVALFALMGAGQMAVWADGKHRRYRRTFTGKDGTEPYPKCRWRIFPPFY